MKRNMIITFLWLLAGTPLMAQSFYIQGSSSVTLSTGSILSVTDSLVNNGAITNNGNMVMGGVWYNLGTYNPGTGEITFNSPTGSGPQVINHNNQAFTKLRISGGGEKLILADLTIVEELILDDGVIGNEDNHKVTFNSGAIITGGSDQSHITGPVYQQGTGDKLFPVGNGTIYLPVEILGITTDSEVGVTLVEFSTPQSFEFKQELSAVSDKRYWEMDVVNGSLTGTKVSLPIQGDEGLSTTEPTTQYVIVQSSTSPIEFESLGQSNFTGSTTGGRIVSDNAVTDNLISIGILSEGIVVYNAISADGDERNTIMRISNITLFPKNVVSIFNRWGDKVFEVKGYDNDQKAFRGESNIGGTKELPADTYFYVIDLGNGSSLVNGYLSLKR